MKKGVWSTKITLNSSMDKLTFINLILIEMNISTYLAEKLFINISQKRSNNKVAETKNFILTKRKKKLVRNKYLITDL